MSLDKVVKIIGDSIATTGGIYQSLTSDTRAAVCVNINSDEWLEVMDRKKAQKIPYRGREYNAYETTWKQRQMEMAMREKG